jgi:hypothetical protein
MSATVHRLFPGLGNKPQASASSSGLSGPMAPNPLVDALRAATTPIFLKQLRALFEGADDALFGMSQRAAAAEEHRSSFDIMRMLRLERRRIETDFGRCIGESFRAAADATLDEFDLDRLSIAPTEELEERIAVGNLITKAETEHQALLKDVSARIVHMIRDLGIPVSRQALTPAVVCNAFKSSLATIDLPLPVRLLLYKLFDRSCMSRLAEPLRAALNVLEAHQVKAPEPEPQPPPSPTWSPYEARPVPTEPDEPLEAPILDSATRGALRDVGKELGSIRPQDAAFADELLALSNIDDPEQATVKRVAPTQRMSLVGQMCNEILSDPHLPASMRPLFERLRFPLIKIALADGTFFGNRVHPVRRLIAEAAETAASSRVATPAVVRRLEERLRQIAEQIDLSATFVRPQIAYLLPLSMPEIASFLDQQREESETRRENVLNKVRRTVAQELEVHTLGRKPPSPLVHFLRMGWGPLMAARLLRHGMNSRAWIDAINRLVQVLASMDVIDVTDDHRAMRAEILKIVGVDLAEIGMREDKVLIAQSHLEKAYAEVDERISKLTPEEREWKTTELELLTPTETAAVLAEFPVAGARPTRAPSPEVAREPVRSEAPRDPLLDFVITIPPKAPAPPAPTITPPATPPVVIDAPIVAATRAAAPTPPTVSAPTSPQRPPEPPAKATQAPPPKAEAVAPPPAAPAPVIEVEINEKSSDAELLALCLTAESWFRVFDASNGQTLWLKVSRYYPEHDTVGFNGFDAKKTLSMRASKFIQDLVAGRSEPVNASPVQMRAMAELRLRHKLH